MTDDHPHTQSLEQSNDHRPDALSEIAVRGHKRRRENASREQKSDLRRRSRQNVWRSWRYRRRLLTSMLPLKHLSGGLAMFFIILGVPLLWVALFGWLEVLPPSMHTWLVPLFLAMPLNLFLAAWGYARLRLHFEQAWCERHPFPLTGYPNILGGKAFSVVEVQIQFKENTPDKSLLRDLVAAARMDTTLRKLQGRHAMIVVAFRKGSKFDGQRAWLRSWTRHFVSSILLPLHREYPIKNIQFPEPSYGD